MFKTTIRKVVLLPVKRRKKLSDYGFTQITSRHFFPVIIGACMILAWLLILLLQHFRWLDQTADQADILTFIISVGAVILAYSQWDENKKGSAFDQYYQRLDLTNRKLEAWPHARQLFPHFWQGAADDEAAFEQSMYVYLELDNLEYAVEKYRLGYMDSTVANRSLEAFQSRCKSAEFRRLVIALLKGSGYQSSTKKVVSRVLKDY